MPRLVHPDGNRVPIETTSRREVTQRVAEGYRVEKARTKAVREADAAREQPAAPVQEKPAEKAEQSKSTK